VTVVGVADRRAPLLTIGIAVLAVLAASLGLLVPGDASRLAAAAAATAVLAVAFLTWPTLTLMAFAMVMLLSSTIAGFVPGIRLLDEMAIPILLLVAVVRQRSRIGLRLLWPRELAVALIFAAGVVSSLLQGVELATWLPAIGLLAKPIAVFYTALLLDWDDLSIRSAVRVGFTVGLLVLAVAAVELVVPRVVPELSGRDCRPSSRCSSTPSFSPGSPGSWRSSRSCTTRSSIAGDTWSGWPSSRWARCWPRAAGPSSPCSPRWPWPSASTSSIASRCEPWRGGGSRSSASCWW
jgi:hypothetical protein